MVLKLFHSIPFLRSYYQNHLGPGWVEKKIDMFLPFLQQGDKILDVGAGGGLITTTLRKRGFDVCPLDIADLSYYPDLNPIIYDGENMPFGAKEFDVALLLTILHHTESPEAILAEAARVSKRVIIIEDIYSSSFQKYLTFGMDRLINYGFSPCPHTNKNDQEWKALFSQLDLKLQDVTYHQVLKFFTQASYHLVSRS